MPATQSPATESNMSRVEGSIHLQFIGDHRAIAAGNLRVGDVTVWNGGGMSPVLSIDRETAKFVFITFSWQDYRGTQTTQRKLKKARLVGFKV